MIFKDYYKILGLETNKVGTDEIKAAYREQAKKYHPDVNVGVRGAEERFKDINEAYQTLINEQTRKKYDRMWNSKIKRKMAKEQKKEGTKTTTRNEILSILFGINNEKVENVTHKKEKNAKIPVQG